MFFLSDLLNKKVQMPRPEEALPGRDGPIPTASKHFVSRHDLKGPYPEGLETALFGLGCFWGAERLFWQTRGVWVTAVGIGPSRPGSASSGLGIWTFLFSKSLRKNMHFSLRFWSISKPAPRLLRGPPIRASCFGRMRATRTRMAQRSTTKRPMRRSGRWPTA